jgi:hypothetical protein
MLLLLCLLLLLLLLLLLKDTAGRRTAPGKQLGRVCVTTACFVKFRLLARTPIALQPEAGR